MVCRVDFQWLGASGVRTDAVPRHVYQRYVEVARLVESKEDTAPYQHVTTSERSAQVNSSKSHWI